MAAAAAAIAMALVVWQRFAAAAELRQPSVQAFDEYAARAQRAFVDRAQNPAPARPSCEGITRAEPGAEDGIIDVPDALVHHWRSRAFVRGITIDEALAVSRDYADYADIYKEVIASRLLSADGGTYHVALRLKSGAKSVIAVLDIRSTIQYLQPSSGTAITLSSADEIREVKNAGSRAERLLPAGRGNGYLWRASTFTAFHQLPDGLSVEMESLGLSREFPPMLGWMIEPIARRLGRRSVEGSLEEFLTAIRKRTAHPGAVSLCR